VASDSEAVRWEHHIPIGTTRPGPQGPGFLFSGPGLAAGNQCSNTSLSRITSAVSEVDARSPQQRVRLTSDAVVALAWLGLLFVVALGLLYVLVLVPYLNRPYKQLGKGLHAIQLGDRAPGSR
jgi:hypothetical protein